MLRHYGSLEAQRHKVKVDSKRMLLKVYIDFKNKSIEGPGR